MKLVTGIDLIEIERVAAAVERHGARFLNRVFTPLELAEAGGSPSSLAARFAAKEAVAKALGCGIGPIGWQEIEIRRQPGSQPVLHLSGEAARLAAELGLDTWSVSLTHARDQAAAVVVGVGE